MTPIEPPLLPMIIDAVLAVIHAHAVEHGVSDDSDTNRALLFHDTVKHLQPGETLTISADHSAIHQALQMTPTEQALRDALERIRGEIEPAKRYAEGYGLQGGKSPLCSAVHIKLDLIDGYARQALVNTPAEDGWLPIDCFALKTDDQILVANGLIILVGCWVEEAPDPPRWSAWVSCPGEGLGEDGTWGDPPTHWRPLPLPPTGASRDD